MMKKLDDLLMTFFAAAVIVSPLAGFGGLLAPAEAHRVMLMFAAHVNAVWA